LVSLLALTGAWVALVEAPSEAGTGGIRFASPTVVNHFAPGFEPGVVVDESATASRGRLYSSWPNGFTSTISYVYRSDDNGESFHPLAGSVGGKPATCVGGGDSELQISRMDGQLLFADLQGLTNFSTSASKDGGDTFRASCTAVVGAGVDRQWIAVDDNGGTAAIGSGPADGRAYLFYDNVLQSTSEEGFGGNQPVVNASADGVNYGGCLDEAAVLCKGPAAVFSDENDIVGNAFVDGNRDSSRFHTVYQVRGSNDSSRVLMSSCRGAPPGQPTTAAATAALCTDPSDFDPDDSGRVNPHWTDHTVAALPEGYRAQSFVVGAIDTAGNVYATWAQYKIERGEFASTGQVMLSTSTDGGQRWSRPRQLNAPDEPTVIFPWITAGDPGRIAVAWYGSRQAAYRGRPGPDPLEDGLWDVTMAQSLDALSSTPTVTRTTVSDHHVKYGNVSTGGLGGAQDRSLGDFLQIETGLRGEAILSYVDDTSGNRNNDTSFGSGQTPSQAAGPTMVARQIAGPSLYASIGSVGAGRPAEGAVTDPSAVGRPDAYLALAGTNTDATPALDIAEVTMAQPDPEHLIITMSTADKDLARHLAPNPTLGGVFANWRVRWAGRYGTSGQDGQIWYVGMQAGPQGTPEFYVGKTASIDSTKTKYFAFPTGTSVPGSISEGGVITWTVPTSAIGNPKKGDSLFSVTGFVATSAIPARPIVTTLPTGTGQIGDQDTLTANLIDAAPSFSFTLGKGAAPKAGPGGGPDNNPNGGRLAATGLSLPLALAAVVLLALGLAGRRRQRT